MYLIYKQHIFLKYMQACVYLFIHNNTHILCKQKLLFWMRLIAIIRLTALIIINEYIIVLAQPYNVSLVIFTFYAAINHIEADKKSLSLFW